MIYLLESFVFSDLAVQVHSSLSTNADFRIFKTSKLKFFLPLQHRSINLQKENKSCSVVTNTKAIDALFIQILNDVLIIFTVNKCTEMHFPCKIINLSRMVLELGREGFKIQSMLKAERWIFL